VDIEPQILFFIVCAKTDTGVVEYGVLALVGCVESDIVKLEFREGNKVSYFFGIGEVLELFTVLFELMLEELTDNSAHLDLVVDFKVAVDDGDVAKFDFLLHNK
jgi:hypothetical protein